jgi:hypothetical protein
VDLAFSRRSGLESLTLFNIVKTVPAIIKITQGRQTASPKIGRSVESIIIPNIWIIPVIENSPISSILIVGTKQVTDLALRNAKKKLEALASDN